MGAISKDFETLVKGSVSPSLYNSKDFIELICRVYGIESRHQVVSTPAGAMGVPSYRIKSMLSGTKISTQPFGIMPPLVGLVDEDRAVMSLIESAKAEGKGCHVEYKSFGELSEALLEEHSIHKQLAAIHSVLPLQKDYAEQLAGYSKSLRQSLRTTTRRAQEGGIEFIRTKAESDLKAWYKVLVKAYRDKHRMIAQPYALFKGIVALAEGELYLAKKNGEVLAGIVMIKDGRYWEYGWSAYQEGFAKLGLSTILIDQAIQDGCAAGAHEFSFGASSLSDVNLRKHKAKWGCKEKELYYYYWNKVVKPKDLNSEYGLMKKAIAVMPLFVLEKLPTFIVPQLA